MSSVCRLPVADVLLVYLGYFAATRHPHILWTQSISRLHDLRHMLASHRGFPLGCEEHAAVSLWASVIIEELLLVPNTEIPANLLITLYEVILPGLVHDLPDMARCYLALFEPRRRSMCGPNTQAVSVPAPTQRTGRVGVQPKVREWTRDLDDWEDGDMMEGPGNARHRRTFVARVRLEWSHPSVGSGIRVLMDSGCYIASTHRLRIGERLLRRIEAVSTPLPYHLVPREIPAMLRMQADKIRRGCEQCGVAFDESVCVWANHTGASPASLGVTPGTTR